MVARVRAPAVCPPQKAVPPASSWPFTESQCFPASGRTGFFVAASIGHLTMALLPTRAPKFEPSRSGFSLTLNTVPAAKLAAVMFWRASCAVPAISTPHSTYLPSPPLAIDLWSGARR